jgi:DNA end-binding protein Ku
MAARSIWSGTISFGLVSVPVRMFSATQSKELKFHFVHKDDMAPVGYDKVRKDNGEHVDADEIVRAFEVEKGHYVPVTEEDIDRLDIELTHSIEICDWTRSTRSTTARATSSLRRRGPRSRTRCSCARSRRRGRSGSRRS